MGGWVGGWGARAHRKKGLGLELESVLFGGRPHRDRDRERGGGEGVCSFLGGRPQRERESWSLFFSGVDLTERERERRGGGGGAGVCSFWG